MSIKENVSTAAQIMLEKKVSRLVVIDEDDNQNNLVGIISVCLIRCFTSTIY